AAAAERSLFGKIDIEGSEWGAFAAAHVSTLKKFRQLVVEFHSLQEVHKHPDYLKAMLKLQLAGFRVVHLHGNNNVPMFDTTDYKIPQVVEVTFDSSAQPIATCLQDQQMHPLDMPNIAGTAELPLAHLPSF
ncbi:ML2, partial [Symbiodinium sp. CCMP2456]